MRTILAIAGLLLCSLSFAQGIPSAASGVYLTPDRVCRVVFSRWQVSWLRVDLTCLQFDGMLSNAQANAYLPGDGVCLPDNLAVAFNPQNPVDYVTFRSAGGNALAVQVGTQGAVVNGVGTNQAWSRITAVASPSPFACATSQPAIHIPRLCREFGLYCG